MGTGQARRWRTEALAGDHPCPLLARRARSPAAKLEGEFGGEL